jgi:hypothetical protein
LGFAEKSIIGKQEMGGANIEQIESFEDVKPTFIYIPDISGYTQFINSTQIKYSSKLIHELLEVIIDSNILNLKIAEIQGDAILFYKLGTPPSISKLESQVKRTFRNFHESLERMREKYPVLHDAPDLTLKIIVHHGFISTTQVKGVVKLLGSDMVLAHRILKNNVKEKEYLLMTEQYVRSQKKNLIDQSFSWSDMKSGKKTYEHIGTIHYKHLCLSTLKEPLTATV